MAIIVSAEGVYLTTGDLLMMPICNSHSIIISALAGPHSYSPSGGVQFPAAVCHIVRTRIEEFDTRIWCGRIVESRVEWRKGDLKLGRARISAHPNANVVPLTDGLRRALDALLQHIY